MPNKEKRLENLKKANEESHSLIVESLKSALYELLETKEISEIKVVDLTKKAGVSRGGFYRNFYLVTDVLKDDIKMVAEDVRRAMGGDIGTNWEIILDTVLLWAEQDFRESPRHLAARLTEFTHSFFDVEAPVDPGSEK